VLTDRVVGESRPVRLTLIVGLALGSIVLDLASSLLRGPSSLAGAGVSVLLAFAAAGLAAVDLRFGTTRQEKFVLLAVMVQGGVVAATTAGGLIMVFLLEKALLPG
jgi:hypothetical protein